jgi:hypothetical protein
VALVTLVVPTTATIAPAGADTSNPATTSSKPPQTGPLKPAGPPTDPVVATSGDLGTALTNNAPSGYAGLKVQGKTIKIHVVPAGERSVKDVVGKELAALGARAVPESSITYVDATETLASLTQRQDALTAQADALRKNGIDVVSWGPQVADNALLVEVHNLNASGCVYFQQPKSYNLWTGRGNGAGWCNACSAGRQRWARLQLQLRWIGFVCLGRGAELAGYPLPVCCLQHLSGAALRRGVNRRLSRCP